MQEEKSLNDLRTPAELRAALSEYNQGLQPAKPQPPDAPGCEGLSDAARETARDLYGAALMKKQAGALSIDEKRFLRESAASVLKDLGY